MQSVKPVDIESLLCTGQPLENFLFSDANILIKKDLLQNKGKKVVNLSVEPLEVMRFYSTLDPTKMKKSGIEMFSSGTTKRSGTPYFRSKSMVIEEICSVEKVLEDLRGKKIFILVTPNHSFGLIPGLLVSRRLTSKVYLNTSPNPIDILRHLFLLQPEVIFAVPAHIRLVMERYKKAGKDLSFLKQIVYGGAILDAEVVEFFEQRDIVLSSIYGMTQTGAIAVNKQVNSLTPNDCGEILPHLCIERHEDNKEFIIQLSNGVRVKTGDKGVIRQNRVVFEGRLDSIIFKNGSKIDLNWLQLAINKLLQIDGTKIEFEKNIDGTSELICKLPAFLETSHKLIFEKIKAALPSYALPSRYQYDAGKV